MAVAGAVIGFMVLGVVRFVAGHDRESHYHADLVVYINGQRQTFEGPQYYQEVAACNEHASPLGRVHLHDEEPNLVHVHDDVVTWSDLFTNFGWSLANSMIYDGKTAYIDGQGGELNFILNGKPTRSIANEVIGDQDRLLISYGTEDKAALDAQFAQLPSDAKPANQTADPATCQGPAHLDVWTRLRQAFLF